MLKPGRVFLALLAVTATGCSSAAATGGAGSHRVSLVAYSTPQKAYDALIPAFQHTAAGRGATVQESFGASGAQSRAVNFCPELLIDLGAGVAKPTRCAKDLVRLRTICRLPVEVLGTEERAGGKRPSRDEDFAPRAHSIGVDPLRQSVQGNDGYHA